MKFRLVLSVWLVLATTTVWLTAQPPAKPAPPGKKPLTAEQQADLKVRDRLAREVKQLKGEGKLVEAIAVLEKQIAIERAHLGGEHEETCSSLSDLAGLQELRADFSTARKLRQEVLDTLLRQNEEQKWRITDARLALAHTERLAALPAEQRQQVARAARLKDEALLLRQAGKPTAAIQPAAEALRIATEVLGSEHFLTADSLNVLGITYEATGAFAKAEEIHRQAVDVRRKLLGEKHPDYAASLNALGDVHLAQGALAKAEPLFQEALAICRHWNATGTFAFAAFSNNLARLYNSKGEFARALPLYQNALAVFQTLAGESSPAYAQGLNNLAYTYWQMGRYGKAEPLYLQALEIRRQVLGREHPNLAQSLNNLGVLWQEMGVYPKAESALREAVEIRRKVLGAKHPLYGQSLNNLAHLYHLTKPFSQAEALYQEALKVRREALGENHFDYAETLMNLGVLYKHNGWDPGRASAFLQRAVEIYRKAVGEKHPRYGLVLTNLGGLYAVTGRREEARATYEQAVTIFRQSLGKEHYLYAKCLDNLAWLSFHEGDLAKAEVHLREAVEVYRKAVGENHPYFLLVQDLQALVYSSQNRYDLAEPLHLRAIDACREHLGTHHDLYAYLLGNLAQMYRHQGRPAKAVPVCAEALAIQYNLLQGGLDALGERPRLRLFSHLRNLLDRYLSLAESTPIPGPELYSRVLDWKGFVARSRAEQQLGRDQGQLRPLVERLQEARARLAHRVFSFPKPAQQKAWLEEIDELREQKERLESELALKSATYRAQHRRQALTPEEVGRVLPEGTVLVDFLEFAYAWESRPEEEKVRRLRAFVVRRDRPVQTVALGDVAPVAGALRTWRDAVRAGDGLKLETAAAELAARVWQPLRLHLAGAKTVLIAPDGVLCGLPFAALPGERPGSYLLEELALGYVGSGRQVADAFREVSPHSTADLLGIGGVDYAAGVKHEPVPEKLSKSLSETGSQDRAGWKFLPGTAAELRNVAAAFRRAFPQADARLLTGANAHEAGLKRAVARSWRYLHLATHGFFESPARVAALRAELLYRPTNSLLPDLAHPNADALDLVPFLHTGIVLAGASRPLDFTEAHRAEDNILTAEEVMELDLRGTELAVLSACDTGLGKLERGDGVLSLQRAFHAAGARTCVASLWHIDDAATTLLMEEFYTNLWQKKLSKLEALRQAQLFILRNPDRVAERRKELWADLAQRDLELAQPAPLPNGGKIAGRSHPALWAAFVLSGDIR